MQTRGKILLTLLFSVALLAFFHLIAIKFYFYWTTSWYDIPMHVWGGVCVALAVLWFIFLSKYIVHPFEFSEKNTYTISIVSILIIGIVWEIFEYKVGLTTNSLADKVDTLKDVIDDSIGALIGSLYFVNNYKK